MPVLHWIGKDKVINHHLEVPYRPLKRRYSFDCDGEHAEDNGSENMIIRGDNLDALKSLLPQYCGRVKCIYIDPPYNTGNEGWVYNDKVNDPHIKKWLGEVVGKEGEDLSRHDKWLCMMYPRLQLLHKLLAEDGVIFISIDYNENYNLRSIMNEIFGFNNFIGEIYWESKTKSQNTKTAFNKLQPKEEMILVYGGHGTGTRFNLITKTGKTYDLTDNRGAYREHVLEEMSAKGMRGRETMIFPISDGVSTVYPRKDKQWKLGQAQVATYQAQNDLFIKNGKVIIKMRPENERNETTEPFWGFFDKSLGTAETAKKELTGIIPGHGFETVKPINMIQRLIFHATDKDSIILDSFAGSGTTAHAVLNMNKKDGGNRKFILIEMMDYAESITAERVKRVIRGYDAGDKAVAGVGGDFSFYELGNPLFRGDMLDPAAELADVRAYVWFTETGQRLPEKQRDNPWLLGVFADKAYFFYYDPKRATVLDWDFLASLHAPLASKVIYADTCVLSPEELTDANIVFKKIPRDLGRL